jgi:uncharacterized protein YoxC
MNSENENIKLIFAVALGAIGGLILGNYIWGSGKADKTMSKHVSTLSQVLKQIEGIDTEEGQDLKERIHVILNIIESSYGNIKEKNK